MMRIHDLSKRLPILDFEGMMKFTLLIAFSISSIPICAMMINIEGQRMHTDSVCWQEIEQLLLMIIESCAIFTSVLYYR